MPGAMRSSLGYLKPYRAPLAWGVVMLALTNAFYLGVPEMMGRAVDAAVYFIRPLPGGATPTAP